MSLHPSALGDSAREALGVGPGRAEREQREREALADRVAREVLLSDYLIGPGCNDSGEETLAECTALIRTAKRRLDDAADLLDAVRCALGQHPEHEPGHCGVAAPDSGLSCGAGASGEDAAK